MSQNLACIESGWSLCLYFLFHLSYLNTVKTYPTFNLSLRFTVMMSSNCQLHHYLLHGYIIYSWVSNGVVGSPAFAAYDQGLCFVLFGLYYKLSWDNSVVLTLLFLDYRVWCFPRKFPGIGLERARWQEYILTSVSALLRATPIESEMSFDLFLERKKKSSCLCILAIAEFLSSYFSS